MHTTCKKTNKRKIINVHAQKSSLLQVLKYKLQLIHIQCEKVFSLFWGIVFDVIF